MRAGWTACLLAASAAAVPLAAPQRIFRAENEMVSVYATVQDGDRLVTDLPREAFEIRDNGRLQPITLFDNGTQPISIVVMLDMSGSMLGNLTLVRNAAVQMFTRLMPSDRARVGSFGERITMSPEFTSKQEDLIRALWLELPAGGPTPLWAAVNRAMTALAHLDGRRVVFVLSDGKDSGGRGGSMDLGRMPVMLPDLMRRAQAEDFMIYAIGMWSRNGGRSARLGGPELRSSEPDPGLRELAAESGGGYYELDETSEMGPAFARIADELHRQYLIGFAMPEADGKRHIVEVRTRSAGLTVRTRKSYVAPKRAPDGSARRLR